jgi:addiction module RelE/StbE family toxin
MRRLVWSKTFLRAYTTAIRRHPQLKPDIEAVLRLLIEDPFEPRLRAHKLKGQLEGTWACSIGYDMRLIFEFVKGAGKEDEILLIEIGTHDEVY